MQRVQLAGVDRAGLQSIWTPNVRWIEVTELGFEGDKVIDANYDGSEKAMEQLRHNILRSGEVGRLVADNFKSSIVQAPLIDIDPASGEILALATAPLLNPNAPRKEDLRNRAVLDTFEVGSTAKAIVLARALDEGAITPTTSVLVPRRSRARMVEQMPEPRPIGT